MNMGPLSEVHRTIVFWARPRVIQQLEQLADVAIVLDHAVGIQVLAGLVLDSALRMVGKSHAARREPHEEGLAVRMAALDEVHRTPEILIVDAGIRFLSSGPVSVMVPWLYHGALTTT